MISVLINNHNYGDYIGEAIESVLSQTYKDFEIIIVDGASTDNSRRVIMSYVDKYPNIITAVFKPTSGQAAAFNVGFKLCKGEIIAFLDSDDFFYPNKLERIRELHKTYEFVGHGRKIHDNKNCFREVVAIPDDFSKRELLFHKYGYIYTYNLITSCISARRELLEKILPMPEDNYITFADCYVKCMAQYYCNIKYLPEALSYYRIHDKQRVQAFKNDEKINEFVQQIYNRVFHDINDELMIRGEMLIPILTDQNLEKALSIANPNSKIHSGGKYAIYGVGVNSIKVFNLIKHIGGRVVMVFDSNPEKWGSNWNDLTVMAPDDISNNLKSFDQIIIGSAYYYKEISDILISLGLILGKDFSAIVSIPND